MFLLTQNMSIRFLVFWSEVQNLLFDRVATDCNSAVFFLECITEQQSLYGC